MIAKHEWDLGLNEWIIEERERLGGPPMPEEVVAFTRGELPESEAERVRALLVYYPELTSLLDEVETPAPWNYARLMTLAAAVVIAVLSVLLVQKTRENREPFAYTARHVVDLRLSRGHTVAQVYALPVREEKYLLDVLLPDDLPYRAYRVDIVDTRRSKIVWSKDDVQPPITIAIRRSFLRAGMYRMDIYGATNARMEMVERCWLRAR